MIGGKVMLAHGCCLAKLMGLSRMHREEILESHDFGQNVVVQLRCQRHELLASVVTEEYGVSTHLR